MGQKTLIVTYNKSDEHTELIENFRKLSFADGNDSLSFENFVPKELDGQIFLYFIDDELASISAIERSTKYTQEYETARICRYHILKKFRHCNAGFKMLPYQFQWARDNNVKLVYWTHDVNNRALNAMYQHKKIMPGKKSFFEDPEFQSVEFIPTLRFIAGPVVQYVYAKKIDPEFNWNPRGQMIQVPA